MAQILTQAEARQIRDRLTFCYLCGQPLSVSVSVNRDHIPPKRIFAAEDRNWPLVLPTHEHCNSNRSKEDNIVKALFDMIHRNRKPAVDARILLNKELTIAYFAPNYVGLNTPKLDAMVGRWIRGFHAALYGEFLPASTTGRFFLPFPVIERVNQQLKFKMFPEERALLVALIKTQRFLGNVDRIECNNGKCLYHCVWQQQSDASWCCAFALKIYNWGQPLLPTGPNEFGCVGGYRVLAQPVVCSTEIGSRLYLPVPNSFPLDPFRK
jgi:hypothetical protein